MYECIWHKVNFQAVYSWFRIRDFSSRRMVTLPRPKKTVYLTTGWNDKTVAQKKTTLQLYDVWPNEVVQRVQVGGGGGSERRVQSRNTPSEAKPGSLWTCGPAPSPAATPRICHRPHDCTRGSPHCSAHPGTLWCWLSSRLRRCEVAWCGPHLKPHQNHNRCRKA